LAGSLFEEPGKMLGILKAQFKGNFTQRFIGVKYFMLGYFDQSMLNMFIGKCTLPGYRKKILPSALSSGWSVVRLSPCLI
jgi:hypothetical protein